MVKNLERVTSAKLLGLTISSNLMCNEHISDVIKKVSKRLYFLVQLKRSRDPRHDMSMHVLHCLYTLCSYVRSTCLFLRPGLPYQETIELVNIVPVVGFITGLCSNTFDTIIKDPEHCLNRLIQFSGPSGYALRCNRRFIVPKCETDRFRNSFII